MHRVLRFLFKRRVFPFFISIVLISFSMVSIWGLSKISIEQFDRDSAITITEEPGTNQHAIGQLNKGDRYRIIKEDQNWLKIELDKDGKEGWIPEWQLANPKLNDVTSIAGQALDSIVLYAEPDENSLALETIPKERFFKLNNEISGWSQVTFQGRVGYVKTDSIAMIPLDEVPKDALEKFTAQENQTTVHNPSSAEAPLPENVIVMRETGQPFYEAASYDSPQHYITNLNEEFSYISSVGEDSDEFYLVQNQMGQRGYILATACARKKDSENHVGKTQVTDMKKARILLDAGHGGNDPGAQSLDNQVLEKNVTLNTALELKSQLEKLGAQVDLTRHNDATVELEERVQISNQADKAYDIFISIHYDGSYDLDANGTTTYYFHQADEQLAQVINQHVGSGPLPNLGIRFGNFQVLRENNRPALLLELGYMTNATDTQQIRTKEYQELIAQKIAQGVEQYITQFNQ